MIPHDAKALGVLQELFPERKVVGLRCNEVVAGLGAIHCVTQQEPEAPFLKHSLAPTQFCCGARHRSQRRGCEFHSRILIIAI